MRLKEICDSDDLLKYCNLNKIKGVKSNNSGSLKIKKYPSPIKYFENNINGIIISYNTPIGVLLDNGFITLDRNHGCFKSTTTNRILGVLNQFSIVMKADNFRFLMQYIGEELGWLK